MRTKPNQPNRLKNLDIKYNNTNQFASYIIFVHMIDSQESFVQFT